jgi:hypothetical protein
VLVAGWTNWASGGYRWSQVFYRGVLYIPAYPADYVPTPLVQTYLQALTIGVRRMATELPREIVVLVLGLGLSVGIFGAGGRNRIGAWMALLATSAMIGRILVYPCVEERYFYFNYLLIAYAAVDATERLLRSLGRASTTPIPMAPLSVSATRPQLC